VPSVTSPKKRHEELDATLLDRSDAHMWREGSERFDLFTK
jgi:hypothetical protein